MFGVGGLAAGHRSSVTGELVLPQPSEEMGRVTTPLHIHHRSLFADRRQTDYSGNSTGGEARLRLSKRPQQPRLYPSPAAGLQRGVDLWV